MKLVIEISEYDREWIKNIYGIPQDIDMTIARAIINGTSLHEWISVNEELPEVEKYVLVHLTDDFYDPIQIMSLHFRESTEIDNAWNLYWKTQEESIEFEPEEVVAWMPLPKPYKEQKK